MIHPLVAAKPNLRERESVHPARNILKRWIPTLGAPGRARSRDIHTQRRERKPERFRSRRSRSVWAQNDVCMREATRDRMCALRGSGKRLDTKWHCGRKVVMISSSAAFHKVRARASGPGVVPVSALCLSLWRTMGWDGRGHVSRFVQRRALELSSFACG